MSGAGYDPRRAWRLVGVLAPVSVVACVAAALVTVVSGFWGMWVAGALLLVLAGVAGWIVFRGESPVSRVFAALAVAAVSTLSTFLIFFGSGSVFELLGSGLLAESVPYAIVGLPWVVLVVVGTVAARAGRYEGAARVTIWWIVAVGASGLASPLFLWLGSMGLADDLSGLFLYFVPALALGLWLGPLTVVGGRALVPRGPGSAHAALTSTEGVSAR